MFQTHIANTAILIREEPPYVVVSPGQTSSGQAAGTQTWTTPVKGCLGRPPSQLQVARLFFAFIEMEGSKKEKKKPKHWLTNKMDLMWSNVNFKVTKRPLTLSTQPFFWRWARRQAALLRGNVGFTESV